MFAFVLMPFGPQFDDIYQLGIKEAAKAVNIQAERVDEQIFNETMLDRIYNQINAADIIIAEMTGKNPNVFYEVGYAHAKRKYTILLTSDAADIPFDLKQHRHIVYGGSISKLKSGLIKDLGYGIKHLTKPASGIEVQMGQDAGQLIRSAYEAEAKVSLVVDMHNRSNDDSPVIQNVYFYTGGGWEFSVDGYSCPQTHSDVTEYEVRHLIPTQQLRLERRSGWRQIRLSGAKVLARAIKGEKLHDTYTVAGKAMLRLVAEGNPWDYTFNLDIKVSEYPI